MGGLSRGSLRPPGPSRATADQWSGQQTFSGENTRDRRASETSCSNLPSFHPEPSNSQDGSSTKCHSLQPLFLFSVFKLFGSLSLLGKAFAHFIQIYLFNFSV